MYNYNFTCPQNHLKYTFAQHERRQFGPILTGEVNPLELNHLLPMERRALAKFVPGFAGA